MNILHISPYLPSLNENHAGGVCMGKEIETLRTMHQVYVLTFIASDFDLKLAKELKHDSRYHFVKINKLSRLIHILIEPWMPNYFAARSSIRFLLKLIWYVKKYHVEALHAEYAAMGQYLWIKKIYPHIILNLVEHDVTIQSYDRKIAQKKGLYKTYLQWQRNIIYKYEAKYCRIADTTLVFNEKDKKIISEVYQPKDIKVLNPYFGINIMDIKKTPNEKKFDFGNICFAGQMGREENFVAAERLVRIVKQLKTTIPILQLYIVGNNPPRELIELENKFIHVTGFVSDLDKYIENAQIAVFPLTLGAGIKLKVLRSLALGTPVITTAIGAEGIDEEGNTILLAETDDEFAIQIQKTLQNQTQYKELSNRSIAFVKQRFNWEKSEIVLKELYENKGI